jgi:NAD-dependent DNA ligase
VDCPAQLKNNVRHLAGRGALDVDGLGEKLIEQLVDRGLVKRLSDVFELNRDALLELDRMAEKSADNLLAALDRARATTLERFLIALGIRHVGSGVAELLAAHFGDLPPLMRSPGSAPPSPRAWPPSSPRSTTGPRWSACWLTACTSRRRRRGWPGRGRWWAAAWS